MNSNGFLITANFITANLIPAAHVPRQNFITIITTIRYKWFHSTTTSTSSLTHKQPGLNGKTTKSFNCFYLFDTCSLLQCFEISCVFRCHRCLCSVVSRFRCPCHSQAISLDIHAYSATKCVAHFCFLPKRFLSSPPPLFTVVTVLLCPEPGLPAKYSLPNCVCDTIGICARVVIAYNEWKSHCVGGKTFISFFSTC